VTKAAPGWYSDGTNKAYWEMLLVNFSCSVLSIVLNSFIAAVACTLLPGPAQASITVQTSIDNGATWTNNTGSFY
jgi:hypothetical protein